MEEVDCLQISIGWHELISLSFKPYEKKFTQKI